MKKSKHEKAEQFVSRRATNSAPKGFQAKALWIFCGKETNKQKTRLRLTKNGLFSELKKTAFKFWKKVGFQQENTFLLFFSCPKHLLSGKLCFDTTVPQNSPFDPENVLFFKLSRGVIPIECRKMDLAYNGYMCVCIYIHLYYV